MPIFPLVGQKAKTEKVIVILRLCAAKPMPHGGWHARCITKMIPGVDFQNNDNFVDWSTKL
jgi:hypothetical protein